MYIFRRYGNWYFPDPLHHHSILIHVTTFSIDLLMDMINEKEIINRILDKFPRSANQLNQRFESDAEILKNGSGHLLFTADEFSGEDLFRDNDPYVLGWNLATGTLSDILASGGDPIYYAHSLSLDQDKWDENYLDAFAVAIADVLKQTGATFIGGDTGISDNWHYTGIALGSAQNPLMRRGSRPSFGSSARSWR